MAGGPVMVRSTLSAQRCLAAVQHVAGLFGTTLRGGPALYTVAITPAAANPQLIVQLGAQTPTLDDAVQLRIAIAAGSPTMVQIEAATPLYYLTAALGFDRDGVSSFATTLQATLHADAGHGRRPTFPAPPRPPG
jgi:hypothetical protein